MIEMDDYLKKLEGRTYNECRHLYSDNIRWETGTGWNSVVRKFSIKCEELSIRFYKKYRLKIVAEQIKQKYGELRLYCSVTKDPSAFLTFIRTIFEKTIKMIDRLNFEYAIIKDTPSYKKHVISLYKTNEKRNDSGFITCSNVKTYDWNGRFVKVTHYDVYGTQHNEPTKHKFLYWLRGKLYWIISKIECTAIKENPPINESSIRAYMDEMLDEYTRAAEKEAVHTCEECGAHLDDTYTKRCWTLGWITCLCEKCAKNSGRLYSMDGKIYKNGVYIKDEETFEEESL